MAYIRVDYKIFELTAQDIDKHIYQSSKNMNILNGKVASMLSVWYGKDYSQFKLQWDSIFEETSAYSHIIKSLTLYSKDLRYTARRYRAAQEDAVRMANAL